MSGHSSVPTIAIFPWGDVVEEFLEPIGLSLEDFAARMTGGWLFGYVAALEKAGWRPVIVCASDSVLATTDLIHAGTGVPIWAVPGKRARQSPSPTAHSLRRWFATPLKAFRRVVEREGCRALMIQEYEYTRFDALVRLARRLGIPAYATFQGGDRTLSWIEGVVRPRSMRLCSGFVIASSAERGRVERMYRLDPMRIAAVPNPLDSDEWTPMDRQLARRQLDLRRDAFIAINHGRIDIRRKGQDVLLRAWAAAGGDELIIIGSGQDHETFAALLAASGLRNVRWISSYMTDRTVLRRWLSAADIYVTASRIEGMPVAPLEAMACGLPVVVTDAQGLPDILQDGEDSGGLIVPCEDEAALAAAIDRLRTNLDLRMRLSRAARRRVVTSFSVPAVANGLRDLLAGQVGENGMGHR